MNKLLQVFSRFLLLNALLLACTLVSARDNESVWKQWVGGNVRAVNVLPTITPAELDRLQQDWAINALRVQLVLTDEVLSNLTDRGLAAQPRLKGYLEQTFEAAHARNIGVIVDLHRAEGGAGHEGKLWTDARLQSRLVQLWSRLAAELRHYPALIGYDILNEPTPPDDFRKAFYQVRGTMQDWNVLARRIVVAIRAKDPETPVIVETTDWAKPFRLKQLEPVNDARVVYSFHMYAPFELTHQGINQYKRDGRLTYPGRVAGKLYDQAELRSHLQVAVDFAQRHGAPMFVGEFGINMYASDETRRQYIADLLEIFGDHGWSWAYHAFGIWEGWMPTPAMQEEFRKSAR